MLKALHSSLVEVIKKQGDQVTSLLTWLNNKAPQKLSAIMEGLTLKHRPSFKKNYIKPALEAKLVAMTAPESPRSPQQKYYLTSLGQSFLNV